jgi:predicted nucleic acid-binding protein
LIDRPCADELLRVLGYRKCGLSREDVEVLLESYLPYATTVDSVGRGPRDVPECSDPEDQKFLDLAAIGRAEVLVTGDRALLDCAGMTKVAIERPSDFRGRLTIAASQS